MAEGPHSAVIREATEAFNRHDVEAVLACVTEDVEWKRIDGLPDDSGVIRGHEAVREFMRPEVFEWMRVEPRELAEAGDTVLMHVRVAALGAASGVKLEVDAYAVYEFEGALVRRVENYSNRAAAEAAAGLSLS